MVGSYNEFKNAVYGSLKSKVAERLDAEKERISNNLFKGVLPETEAESSEETQSNEVQN